MSDRFAFVQDNMTGMSVEAAKQNVPGHQVKPGADSVPAKDNKKVVDGTPEPTAKEILEEQKPSHRRQESSASMLDKGPSSVCSDSVVDEPLTPKGDSGELKDIQSLNCNGNQEKNTSQKSSISESFV